MALPSFAIFSNEVPKTIIRHLIYAMVIFLFVDGYPQLLGWEQLPHGEIVHLNQAPLTIKTPVILFFENCYLPHVMHIRYFHQTISLFYGVLQYRIFLLMCFNLITSRSV